MPSCPPPPLGIVLLLPLFCLRAPAQSPNGDFLPSDNFTIGASASEPLTSSQMEFLNQHFAYFFTPILANELRDAVKGPELYLYRNIQGVWEDSSHFDWVHINGIETMFCHNEGARIQTLWGSWLMDPADVVYESAQDAHAHWVNYFATTSARQVYEHDYDGLFLDSAAHRLNEEILLGPLPEGYNDEDWGRDRSASLAFVKACLPDKGVCFNGLHSGGGAEESLSLVDGGMWETFCYYPLTGEFAGLSRWFEVISLTERRRAESKISLVGKKSGLTADIPARVFLTASYLLVSHPNVTLYMIDLDDKQGNAIFYYPEFSLDLGQALGDIILHDDTYATRDYEYGRVIVNPNEEASISYELSETMLRALPWGGGLVQADGAWEGGLEFESVSGSIELSPVSALILVYR